jgi:hypothetical protein
MIGDLIMNLLQVNLSTGLSANLEDSQGNAQRVYHQRIWQGNSEEAVVFTLVSQSPDYIKQAVGQHEYEVSVAVYNNNDYEAQYIANQLISILEGWRGTFNGKTWHYTNYLRTVESYNDFFEMPSLVVDFQFIRDN